jgi:hypothetical protein
MRCPAVVSTILFLILTTASFRAQQPSIPVALAKLSTQAADPCENPFPSAPDLDQTQRALFRGISDLVVSVLNAQESSLRATVPIRLFRRSSAKASTSTLPGRTTHASTSNS